MQEDDHDVLTTRCILNFQRNVIVRHIGNQPFVDTTRQRLNADSISSISNQQVLDVLKIHLWHSVLSANPRSVFPPSWSGFPGHEEEPVPIRILETDEPAA